VKSYVRNIVNISWDKILLTSIITLSGRLTSHGWPLPVMFTHESDPRLITDCIFRFRCTVPSDGQ
jgi:hypothetical protein